MKLIIEGPLIGDDLVRAKAALLEGRVVEADGCSLHPDKDDGMIWGVDPYGQDCIAANGLNEASCGAALCWINRASNTDGHRAEFCY